MICIYHNDLDGRCAAAIVERRMGKEINFIEAGYDKVFDFKKSVCPGESVIIVDFSLKPEVMDELLEVTSDVTWIDHHVTAKGYPYQYIRGLRDFDDKSMSGCELAWMYYYPGIKMPDAIRLIGDYDKWALKYQPHCFQFYEGMKLIKHDPWESIWKDLIEDVNMKRTLEIVEAGKMAILYRDNYCNDLCRSFGYETEIDGIKAYACNQFMFGSKGFGHRFDQYPLCLAYVHNGKKFTVSLYSAQVDVSEIAKRYGGGGHRGAAGFVCDQLPWIVKGPGMYEVDNPAYPKVQVGKYTICRQDENSVWIQRDGGEGGQFRDDNFERAIENYFNDNF